VAVQNRKLLAFELTEQPSDRGGQPARMPIQLSDWSRLSARRGKQRVPGSIAAVRAVHDYNFTAEKGTGLECSFQDPRYYCFAGRAGL
jgi:hypothetical protein